MPSGEAADHPGVVIPPGQALEEPAAAPGEVDDLRSSLRLHGVLLDALQAISRGIAARAPLQEVLEGVVSCAQELLGDELQALLLRDGDRDGERGGGRLEVTARLGEGEPPARVAWAALEAEDVVVDGSSIAAPVRAADAVIGVLTTASRLRSRAYTHGEREALRVLAEHAGLAIGDARMLDEMAHQALHDALTGLPNRTLLGDRLVQAVERARRTGSGVAVLMVDLDRFKTINDSLGHLAGDELLVLVARRLRAALREVDTAARLGGDEFALLLEDLGSEAEAEAIAARVLRHLEEPVTLQGRLVPSGASIGISYADSEHAVDLLRAADLALYRSKALGRGRVTTFAPSMEAEARARLELEADLRVAVEAGQLELAYQPLVALPSHSLMGFEALVRWRHPVHGLMPPPAFVAIAEETGTIGDLGRWVLHAACRQAQAWRERYPHGQLDTITVNVSAHQVRPELVDHVGAALDASGLPPRCLVLELTESVLLGDGAAAIACLRAVRELGVRVALDDFGTGWSSLQELLALPLDMVKAPREFVEGLGHEGRAGDEAVIQAIVDLGGTLGLTVVGEGVEELRQDEALRRLGCGAAQGYYYCRPTHATDLTRLLDAPPPRSPWRLGPVPLAEQGLVSIKPPRPVD